MASGLFTIDIIVLNINSSSVFMSIVVFSEKISCKVHKYFKLFEIISNTFQNENCKCYKRISSSYLVIMEFGVN